MEYIQTDDALSAIVPRLSGAPLLAADTEAAGYHRYRDRVCLLQLSTRSDNFVIDTLAVSSLAPIAPLFADDRPEIIFHDADYDLRLLNRDFGIEVHGLFDTKIAAQFLGESAIGLGALAEKYLGIRMEKKHQRADWAQRPLPEDMLAYAAEDTAHLPPLRDVLRRALAERGRLTWAEEEFRLMENARWQPAEAESAFMKVKRARELEPRQLAALREIYEWRERTADARDVAAFRILSNEAMLEVARALPQRVADLTAIRGLPPSIVERRGQELIQAVQRALDLPADELPRFPRPPRRPPPDPDFETRMDRLRAARDRIADELGLDRGFLMPRAQLEEIAKHRPRTLADLAELPDIRKWQVDVLGTKLIEALEKAKQA